jgi:DNA polymerase (family 10)
MSAPEKKRWPLLEAQIVAEALVQVLRPVCERIEIAGSVRRGKQDVGDVELLYVPRYEVRQLDLISSGPVNLAAECIERLLAAELLGKRPSINGSTAWGEKNKLAVYLPTGIPVDLFATTPEAWCNYLVCRTGPADSNTRIATTARQKGWQWCPYDVGFRNLRTGQMHAVQSEAEVFEFVGLPYREPWQRT